MIEQLFLALREALAADRGIDGAASFFEQEAAKLRTDANIERAGLEALARMNPAYRNGSDSA